MYYSKDVFEKLKIFNNNIVVSKPRSKVKEKKFYCVLLK